MRVQTGGERAARAGEESALSPSALARAGEAIEGLGSPLAVAEGAVAWMGRQLGATAVLAASFGVEDCVLVEIVSRLAPCVPVFYLDTGLLFPETHRTRDRLVERYGIVPVRVGAQLTLAEQAAAHGPELFRRDPDLCCEIRKVRPLQAFLATRQGWITGIRREQSPARRSAPVLQWDERFGLVKCNPLVTWTQRDVWRYVHEREIPYNPLHDQGYPSIGCTPCTRPVAPGEDPRAGRWAGFGKTECGLHA